MEPKKHPIRQLNDMRGLYFIIVLLALLALLYVALEWKTPFDDGGYDIDEPIDDAQQQTDSSVIIRTKAIEGDTVSD